MEELLCQRVRKILTDAFPDPSVCSTNSADWGGVDDDRSDTESRSLAFVVSDRFQGIGEFERQTMVWEPPKAGLPPDDWRKIAIVVPSTPSEAEYADSIRPFDKPTPAGPRSAATKKIKKEAMREIFTEVMMTIRVPFEADDAVLHAQGIVKRDRSIRIIHSGGIKRPTRAAIVAAILLEFAGKSDEEQLNICRSGIDRLNAMIEERPAPAPVEKPPTVMIDRDVELAKEEAAERANDRGAGSTPGAGKRKDRRSG